MNTDAIIIDGHTFSWRRICELRRQQLESIRRARMEQLARFDPKDAPRPAAGASAAGPYAEPGLLDWPHTGA